MLPSSILIGNFFSIPHTEMLDQAFAHCQRFSTAAAKNADGPFSVPLWPFSQKGRLWIIGLEC